MLACTAILLLVRASSVSAREVPSDPAATYTRTYTEVARPAPRAVPAGPPAFATLSNVTEGRYIVRFKEGAARLAAGRRLRLRAAGASPSFHEAAHVLIGRLRERLQRAARRQLLRHMESVLAVDHVYHGVFPGFVGPPRGVDLLDSLVGDGKFAYEATGCGANVYLVDSGINFDLYPAQFGRRASVVFDNVHAQGDPLFKRDCNGP
eukprot:tig00000133_g7675.t1